MRYYNIDQIEPGQILGKSIFTANGQVLLAEGVQLTVYMISTMKRLGVTAIYIKESDYDDIVIEDVVSEETKRQVMKQMSTTFEAIRSGKPFSTKQISVSINSLLDEVLQNSSVLLQLSDIRTEDNEAYVHSINVCTMAILVGIGMGLNTVQLKELAIGALFHDIGKIGQDGDGKDPKHHHTWRGFEVLKSKREFSLLSAHTALQHHEAVDGTGEPRKLSSEEIHLYAKIVAAVNTYDNLLSPLTASEQLLPHEAAEKMMALVGTKLDHDVVIAFLKTVSIYPTGSSVKLSNRQTGVVVGQHKGLPSRPIIRVMYKEQQDGEYDVQEIDLAEHPTLFIESTLN